MESSGIYTIPGGDKRTHPKSAVMTCALSGYARCLPFNIAMIIVLLSPKGYVVSCRFHGPLMSVCLFICLSCRSEITMKGGV